MSENINIIIAEDHKQFRKAMLQELQPFSRIKCIGEASNGKELLELLQTTKTCIVLMDLEMPEMNGKEALLQIQRKFPLVKVLIVSQYDDQNILESFEELGAQGFLPKNYFSSNPETLINAIQEIHKGKTSFYYYNSSKKYIRYTRRERELIPLICEGKTSNEIAVELGVGEKAIEKHRRNLFEKTESRNLAVFIKFSIRRGLDFLSRR